MTRSDRRNDEQQTGHFADHASLADRFCHTGSRVAVRRPWDRCGTLHNRPHRSDCATTCCAIGLGPCHRYPRPCLRSGARAWYARQAVFELKIGQVEPEHLGKLSFYVNAVDDQLRKPDHGDGATVGILLAAERDNVVVEYALRGIGTPVAVSTYTTDQDLPDDLRSALPSDEVYAQLVGESRLAVGGERSPKADAAEALADFEEQS